MAHYQREPHPLLYDYLKCIWASERHFQPPHHAFEILPDSYIELIFTYGAPCLIQSGASSRRLPRCAVVGLLDQPLQLIASGVVRVVGARFYAWGFAPLLSGGALPQNALSPIDASWQELAASMEQTLATSTLERATEQLERHLVTRLAASCSAGGTVQTVARQLLQRTGSVSGEGLAESSHYSRRQIERKFSQITGVSPKALAQKLRFEQVRDRLAAEPRACLGRLAHDYGYADQAHLAREFKRFSGKTPRAFAREMASLRGWMREAAARSMERTEQPEGQSGERRT